MAAKRKAKKTRKTSGRPAAQRDEAPPSPAGLAPVEMNSGAKPAAEAPKLGPVRRSGAGLPGTGRRQATVQPRRYAFRRS